MGGGSWQYTPDSGKGKHQLVRDLLLLVASSGDGADAPAAPRASRTPSTTAAGATAAVAAATDGDGDAMMQDADAPTATAGAAAAAAGPAATVPAAAAVAVQAGVVPEKVPLVSAQELIQSARVLLLLLLQLYSSCEEAGVYGRGGEGRHHMQRLQGGGGQPNDRCGGTCTSLKNSSKAQCSLSAQDSVTCWMSLPLITATPCMLRRCWWLPTLNCAS